MLRRVVLQLALIVTVVILTTVFQPLAYLQGFAQGGCQTFPQTGKSICGRFLQYWQTNGGLAQQGYPLTNEFTEASDLDGHSYTVQYFERAVFEKHPENAPPFDVLLSQLGTFRYKTKYPGGDPSGAPPVTQPPSYNKWSSQQVISAFKQAGLEVGNPRLMTRSDYGIAPMRSVEGTRFFIPSLCSDCGGRVLSFAAPEDLAATAKYYNDLSKSSASLFSWVYTRDNILLQINGSLSEPKARAYVAALNNLADGFVKP